jgi:hypothetical protein
VFLFLIELSARKVCSDCPYYNILSSENAKSVTAPQQGTGMLGQIVWNSLLPWYFLVFSDERGPMKGCCICS